MSGFSDVAKALSEAFLAGDLTVDAMEARGMATLGENETWMRDLCKNVIALDENDPSRMSSEHLADFIKQDAAFKKAWQNPKHKFRIRRFFVSPEKMQEPPAALADTGIPHLATTGVLSTWLGLSHDQMEWLANCWRKSQIRQADHLDHYTYKWLPRSGDAPRLLEAPKALLRQIQKKILQEILNRVPPHPAAHGFVKGRSCLTFCKHHVNKKVVLRLDLKRFFPSIRYGRILGLFRTIGYPRSTALRLAGMCTNTVSDAVLAEITGLYGKNILPWSESKMYRHPHLPQGAPTSPAIANLCAYRLDQRLAGAARKSGAVYTRYADDLAFSGEKDFEKDIHRFYIFACAIALEEGFEVNTRKTRIMRQGVCQKLTGIVLNKHINIRRKTYDRLKAMLFNCIRYGPDSQNRDGVKDFRAHLAGKIAYVHMVNPKRGVRLKERFHKIQWD